MKALAFVGVIALLLCFGCEQRGAIHLNADRWRTGDTIWLHVEHLDSVFTPDSNYVRKNTSVAVRFTVVATLPAPRIEWQEFALMPPIDSEGVRLVDEQWFPSTRLLYDCRPDGTVELLVNYEELAANVDTLLRSYMGSVTGLTSAQDGLVRAMVSDSLWIVSTYMTDVDLFHQFHGLQLTGGEDDKAEFLLPELFPGPVESSIALIPDPLCDPASQISVTGTIHTDTIALRSLLHDIPALGQLTDTIAEFEGASTALDVDLSLCFDTARSVPALITQRMRMNVPGASLLKTTTIYINERWTRPGL